MSSIFIGPSIGSPSNPGGSNTQVQFNDNNVFGGDSGLTWFSNILHAANIDIKESGIARPALQLYNDLTSYFALYMPNATDWEIDAGDQSPWFYFDVTGKSLEIANGIIGILLRSDTTIANGKSLRSDTTSSHTALLQAYDVDGAAYSTFLTLLNGNTPDMTIAPPSGGTVTLQASTFKSSDGSTGATGTANNTNTLTIKNGLVTNIA